MLKRLIGLCDSAFNFSFDKSSGLPSNVISAFASTSKCVRTVLIRTLISSTDKTEGVPPPKYMVFTS